MHRVPGTPYHSKENGYEGSGPATVMTGVLGAWLLVIHVVAATIVALGCLLFVIAGVAEVVSDGATHWRVRWIRRAPVAVADTPEEHTRQ